MHALLLIPMALDRLVIESDLNLSTAISESYDKQPNGNWSFRVLCHHAKLLYLYKRAAPAKKCAWYNFLREKDQGQFKNC